MGRLGSAWDRVALVADEGTFEPWDEVVVSDDPLAFADVRSYRSRLEAARSRTGLAESVLTGRALVAGRPAVLVAGEFGFLGGSIGVATGERVARAFERALADRLPLVALPASGGSRMQEGTLALVQMAKLAASARRLRAAGLPYVVCLTDPTTGGVLASWGSLGTVTFALPGALLGFAGPRVVELLTGTALPAGVQTSETLLSQGLVDVVVEPSAVRSAVARVLAVARPGPRRNGDSTTVTVADPTLLAPPSARDAWASLGFARDRRRPGARELLDAIASDVTELRGDRTGRPDDPGCFAALARICGIPAVLIAQRRAPDGTPPALGPAGFRKARRAMALAAELRLPLVTLVDTPGAELSAGAERGGLAGEIAACLAELSGLPVPTLALLIGEGGSGGALALLVADRIVCAEHASLGVIAPEGASAILYRDLDHAPELAAAQGGASWQLERAGIADAVVPEPQPAHEQPRQFVTRLAAVVERELAALLARDDAERLAARHARWRALGTPGAGGAG
ncbi:carboxyl transferase domain-containing protein [Conexibacter woesei]|uniref:Acetyl-coenzyme A carboxylase carboxyl transferase subunits beta/alpha n=1 Tax=Conexibacter woesei (strain DSM 14684 / CCUG 47730 / CIP 108061 / JCM 11494 / NBRC 100937 / ID131577) TaxID=469383 RepID=D3FAX5_CONWI|nr:carboxyl transferase domain-containing protein [Conexibacter woesei]ADB51288.1 carboxyl transferase [Conexibacter woesei DSM 14684]